MSTTSDTSLIPPAVFPSNWTLANLQEHLGGIPLGRIRLYPVPGTATEEDALRLDDKEDCICELVDGILVEKETSYYESILAMLLGHLLNDYLESNNRGIVSGADGQIRLLPTKMRVPDVDFIRWDRFPDGKLPKDRVCRIAPDLVVEILSGQHASRNGTKTRRILRLRSPTRVVHRSSTSFGPNLHSSRKGDHYRRKRQLKWRRSFARFFSSAG